MVYDKINCIWLVTTSYSRFIQYGIGYMPKQAALLRNNGFYMATNSSIFVEIVQHCLNKERWNYSKSEAASSWLHKASEYAFYRDGSKLKRG